MKKFLFFGMILSLSLFSCMGEDDNIESIPIKSESPISLSRSITAHCASNGYLIGASNDNDEIGYWKVTDHENCGDNCHHSALKYYWDYHPEKNENGECVSDVEANYVFEYIRTHPNEGFNVFDEENYYIQFVGCADNTYYTTNKDGNKVAVNNKGHMSEIKLSFNGDKGLCHQLDYNSTSGSRALLTNSKITNAGYKDTNVGIDKPGDYCFYKIALENGSVGYYLCFDYSTKKENEGINIPTDGVFNDYVIKIIPCHDEEVEPSILRGEVEVNLSVKDNEKEDLSYKLSVHVRDTTDFEVYIPLPIEYVCKVDDFYIVEQHKDEKYTYNELATSVERVINNEIVIFYITHEQNGIKVWSNGINANVLKYLRNTYGDGITFELTSYTNGKINFDDLFYLLNKTEIKCSTDNFINPKPNENLDCIVSKVDMSTWN